MSVSRPHQNFASNTLFNECSTIPATANQKRFAIYQHTSHKKQQNICSNIDADHFLPSGVSYKSGKAWLVGWNGVVVAGPEANCSV